MTDSERLWTGITLSLFLHFSLVIFHSAPEEEKAVFHAVLEMEDASAVNSQSVRQGTGLHHESPKNDAEAEQMERKRRAYLAYLDEVDAAIHARRHTDQTANLIGAALCSFIIDAEGRFRSIQIASSSGRPLLDESALRAVKSASGIIRRPAIIGTEDIRVSLWVKYQYAL
ncbi:MAG: energy transducer TonB [Mailhella sp.]